MDASKKECRSPDISLLRALLASNKGKREKTFYTTMAERLWYVREERILSKQNTLHQNVSQSVCVCERIFICATPFLGKKSDLALFSLRFA
jgi:hypothetical protein